jgi:hypothetical protein
MANSGDPKERESKTQLRVITSETTLKKKREKRCQKKKKRKRG